MQHKTVGMLVWCLHYPQFILAAAWHYWRQFISLLAASSGATKGLHYIFHISSSTPQDLYTHIHVLNWRSYPLTKEPQKRTCNSVSSFNRVCLIQMPFFSNNSLFADVYLYFTNHSIVPIKSDFLACIAGRKKKKLVVLSVKLRTCKGRHSLQMYGLIHEWSAT